MTWTIRKVDFDDAPGIGRVQLESWRITYGEYLPDEYLDGMSDVRHAAMWSEVLSKGDRLGATFIAEDDDQGVVGFADCAPAQTSEPSEDEEDEGAGQPNQDRPKSNGADKDETEPPDPNGDQTGNGESPLPGSGEIGSIYVMPDWQRQGIGRGFIANVARHLAAHEFESMVVWVLKDDPGRAFYERLGGDACALREIQFIDTTLVQVCYQWLDISELVLIDLMG